MSTKKQKRRFDVNCKDGGEPPCEAILRVPVGQAILPDSIIINMNIWNEINSILVLENIPIEIANLIMSMEEIILDHVSQNSNTAQIIGDGKQLFDLGIPKNSKERFPFTKSAELLIIELEQYPDKDDEFRTSTLTFGILAKQ